MLMIKANSKEMFVCSQHFYLSCLFQSAFQIMQKEIYYLLVSVILYQSPQCHRNNCKTICRILMRDLNLIVTILFHSLLFSCGCKFKLMVILLKKATNITLVNDNERFHCKFTITSSFSCFKAFPYERIKGLFTEILLESFIGVFKQLMTQKSITQYVFCCKFNFIMPSLQIIPLLLIQGNIQTCKNITVTNKRSLK